MAGIDYEVEYNNRARVPEHAEIFARWARDAAAYREDTQAEQRVEIGIRYGASARQTIDLFQTAGGGSAPLSDCLLRRGGPKRPQLRHFGALHRGALAPRR